MTTDVKNQLAAVSMRIAALKPPAPPMPIRAMRAELADIEHDIKVEEALRTQHGDRPGMMRRAWLAMRRRGVVQDIEAGRGNLRLVVTEGAAT